MRRGERLLVGRWWHVGYMGQLYMLCAALLVLHVHIGGAVKGGGAGRLMRQRGEHWDLVPWRTVLPLCLMVMDVSSNVVMHP